MYFFWVYNQKLKTPSNGTCLGEPLGEFVILCIFIYFHLSMIFILLLYLHLISRLLCHVTSTPPWLLRPVKASTSSELYPDYFWLPFLFHLPRALRFWVDIFYLTLHLLLSRFRWALAATFLEVAGLHTDPRNTGPAHLFVWFTVI